MDRESLNDHPLGKYDVTVVITPSPDRDHIFPVIPEFGLRATLGILARTVEA